MSDALADSDTPRKSQPFSGEFQSRKLDIDNERREDYINMKEKVTVPNIPSDEFVDVFNPPPRGVAKRDRSLDDKVFKELPEEFALERDMYAPIMEALNNAKICPNYTFVATPHKPDGDSFSNEAVYCGMYPSAFAPQPTPGKGKHKTPSAANDWSEIEVAIECKLDPSDGDPFDNGVLGGLRLGNAKCMKVYGQILSYAYYHQHRTHQYIILFIGNYARMIYVDRSCIFVSKRIPYKTDPGALLEFFWRIARHERRERGHDITAERIRDHESVLAQKMIWSGDKQINGYDYPRQLFKMSLTPSWPWWRLTVQSTLPDHSKVERRFLVGRPHTIDPGVSGRGTRSYVALEDKEDDDGVSNPQFVYLKDSWRILHPDIDEEGKVLSILNENGVRFVPTITCHGDIEGQDTKSRQSLWKKYNPEQAKTKECPIKAHSHYRMVVKEVGRPLEDFERSAHLLWIMYCALTAHKEAYTVAGIIHRDVSAGNILIYPDDTGESCGLLNDWEMSKQLKNVRPGGRQLDRTGTWQFLSVAALDNPSKKIILQDDLESFFHVLLYTAIRFFPHNCPDDCVGAFLYRYFDDFGVKAEGDISCGFLKRSFVNAGRISLAYVALANHGKEVELTFLMPDSHPSSPTEHPINVLIRVVLSWLKAYRNITMGPQPKLNQPSLLAPVGLSSTILRELEAMRVRSSSYGSTKATLTRPSRGETDEEDMTLAKNLADHEAMLDLLLRTSLYSHPVPMDKGRDKKPAKGYDPIDAYRRGTSSGLSKTVCPSGGRRRAAARSGDPTTSGGGKRPRDDQDESVDVGDRPTTPKRPRAALPRSDARSGP